MKILKLYQEKESSLTGSGKIQKFKLKDIGLEMLKKDGIVVL